MRLSEISKPTLQEAMGLDWTFDLFETLNTKFDDEAWVRHKKGEIGTAILGDETFQLHLEPITMPIDGINYRAINVAFAKMVDGKPSQELTLTGKNASKIVGAITNALLERVELYDYDAVIFIARDNIDARMTIYNKIAARRWVQEGLGESIQNISLGDGAVCTALLSRELARQKRDVFIEHLMKLKKNGK